MDSYVAVFFYSDIVNLAFKFLLICGLQCILSLSIYGRRTGSNLEMVFKFGILQR